VNTFAFRKVGLLRCVCLLYPMGSPVNGLF
jgi:hypothetical protein